jgi:hypothetical protein
MRYDSSDVTNLFNRCASFATEEQAESSTRKTALVVDEGDDTRL